MLMSVRTHLGYIPFEGRIGGELDNCGKFLLEHKRANMQPVKKVTYSFDPMKSNWSSLRSFMFYWQTKKVKATNVKLITKTEVLDDRSDPRVLFDLNDGRQLEVRKIIHYKYKFSVKLNIVDRAVAKWRQ